MRLTFHIFWKDLRHHWLAIFVSLGLLAGFVWDQPRRWSHRFADISPFSGVLEYLPMFLALAWIFLLVRVVQEESLVGDRQFWVTRPYRWYVLLAAKLLTALFFVHLPLFLAQLLLLRLAMFPIPPAIAGLLQIQVGLFVVVTIPALALGSITRGIGQASLFLIGAFLLLFGIATLTFVQPNLAFSIDGWDNLQSAIALSAAIGILLLQFSRRKTRLSWCVLAVSLLLFLGVIYASSSSLAINRSLPLPTAAHPLPLKLSFDSSVSFQHEADQKPELFATEVPIELPFLLDSLPEDTLVELRGVKLDLDLPTGERWSSQWRNHYEVIIPGRTRLWPSVPIKRNVIEQLQNSAANAHLSLAFKTYRIGPSSSVVVQADSIRLPEDTRCKADSMLGQMRMRCFSALRSLRSFILLADLPNERCAIASERAPESWAAAPALFANLVEGNDVDFDFSPVHESAVDLNRRDAYEEGGRDVRLCSGSTLALARTSFQYTVRTEINLGNIQLNNYIPSYPRQILPKIPRTPSRNPSDTLSLNLPAILFDSRRNR